MRRPDTLLPSRGAGVQGFEGRAWVAEAFLEDGVGGLRFAGALLGLLPFVAALSDGFLAGLLLGGLLTLLVEGFLAGVAGEVQEGFVGGVAAAAAVVRGHLWWGLDDGGFGVFGEGSLGVAVMGWGHVQWQVW